MGAESLDIVIRLVVDPLVLIYLLVKVESMLHIEVKKFRICSIFYYLGP